MVEDYRIDFARRRTQRAAHHLPEETERFGRSRQYQAADVGAVPTLGQHRAVGDELDLAAREAAQNFVALVDRRLAVNVLGHDSASPEFVADMHRVLDAGGEADGGTALPQLVPVGDDVTD